MFSGGTQYSCDESDENEFSEEALMKKKIKSMTKKSKYILCNSVQYVTHLLVSGESRAQGGQDALINFWIKQLVKTTVYIYVF